MRAALLIAGVACRLPEGLLHTPELRTGARALALRDRRVRWPQPVRGTRPDQAGRVEDAGTVAASVAVGSALRRQRLLSPPPSGPLPGCWPARLRRAPLLCRPEVPVPHPHGPGCAPPPEEWNVRRCRNWRQDQAPVRPRPPPMAPAAPAAVHRPAACRLPAWWTRLPRRRWPPAPMWVPTLATSFQCCVRHCRCLGCPGWPDCRCRDGPAGQCCRWPPLGRLRCRPHRGQAHRPWHDRAAYPRPRFLLGCGCRRRGPPGSGCRRRCGRRRLLRRMYLRQPVLRRAAPAPAATAATAALRRSAVLGTGRHRQLTRSLGRQRPCFSQNAGGVIDRCGRLAAPPLPLLPPASALACLPPRPVAEPAPPAPLAGRGFLGRAGRPGPALRPGPRSGRLRPWLPRRGLRLALAGASSGVSAGAANSDFSHAQKPVEAVAAAAGVAAAVSSSWP